MTTKQYIFHKNLRIILITASIFALVFLIFSIFKDQQINAQNILSIVVVILNLFYFLKNKPQFPTAPIE